MGQEWCDAEVLRSIRRRSLAKLRQEVEPVPVGTLARFTPSWMDMPMFYQGNPEPIAPHMTLPAAPITPIPIPPLDLPVGGHRELLHQASGGCRSGRSWRPHWTAAGRPRRWPRR